jgi:predicted permease
METDPGFDPENILTMKLSLGRDRFGDSVALEKLHLGLLPSIESLPGVRRAAVAVSLPLEPGWDLPFILNGRYDEGTGEGWGVAQYRGVSPNFLETMGIPILRGRSLATSDSSDAPTVVVINNTAAARFWPGEDPIGQQITIGPPEFPGVAPPRVIVGVVGDVKEAGLERQPPAILYVPLSQLPERWARGLDIMNLVVKTNLNPSGLAGSVEEKIRAHDSDLPVMNVQTMDQLVVRSVGSREFNMVLMGLFAGLALLLAAVGIYGVLSYMVSQRTHEIGVRMALGAERQHVLKLVVDELMPLVAAGLALGIVGALALNRVISSMLFGVSSTDPATFAGVCLLLAAVALVAGYLPARRATNVEPVVALRYE